MFGNGTKTHHGIKGRDKESGAFVKSIFNNAMTAHVWAQGVQTFGQSTNGNLYFHGRALFSYRNDAPIGYLLPCGAVLISTDSYSITTSGHQWDARRAARGVIYGVPNLDALWKFAYSVPAGGGVVYCQNFESRIDSALADRAHVRAFVADRIAREEKPLDESAARFLLARVGLARSFDKIRRDAIAKRDREAAKARAIAQREAIDRLKQTAAIYRQGRAALIDNLASQVKGWQLTNSNAPASLIDQAQKRIRKARRLAGKDKTPPAAWRDAWQAHGLLGDIESDLARALADRARALSLADRRAARRRLVQAFRNPSESNFGATIETGMHPYEVGRVIIRACELKARAAANLAMHLRAATPHFGKIANIAERLESVNVSLSEFAHAADLSDTMAGLYDDFDARRAEREAQARAEREAAELQARADWLEGKESFGRAPYFSRENGAAYIRAMNIKRNESGEIVAGELQTSQGASVPLVAAIRAFRFIKLVKARGAAWHRNGARVPVGVFQIDSIETSGNFRAGCHSFVWDDIEALALSLGVADLAPDDSAIVRPAMAA